MNEARKDPADDTSLYAAARTQTRSTPAWAVLAAALPRVLRMRVRKVALLARFRRSRVA